MAAPYKSQESMKYKISNPFKDIINFFPKQKFLTELSLLSFYELLMYGLAFFIVWSIMKKWNEIPTREYEVTAEQIDTLRVNDVEQCSPFLDINYNFNFTHYLKTKDSYDYKISITNNDIYDIEKLVEDYEEVNCIFEDDEEDDDCDYPLSEILSIGYTRNGNNYSSIFNKDSAFVKLKNYHLHFQEDSLIKTYRAFYQNTFHENNTPVFYIEAKAKGIVSSQNLYNQKDTLIINNDDSIIASNTFIREKDSITVINKIYGSLGINCASKERETGGVYSKPNFFSMYDISQCYFRFKIKNQSLPIGRIEISFQGANDLYVVNGYPDHISNNRIIFNTLPKEDIVIMAKSKDFENLQNYRMFFLSSLLSALITIFLAFLVIFIYRLLRNISSIKVSSSTSEKQKQLPKL